MKIKVKIISSFDELGPYEKSFAKIRGEYFIWNIKSRYSYNPDFIQKNMRRSNSILDQSLAPYYKMKKSGIFPEDRLEKLKSDFENGQKIFLLFSDKNLAGCARLTRRNKEEAELHSVYTKPEYRGKGYARELLLLLLGKAKQEGYNQIFLDTMPFMKNAIDLYRSLGFVEVDYLDMGYISKQHAKEMGIIFMKKILAD